MAYIPPESDVNFAMEVNGNLAQTMALPLFENIGLDRGLARAVVSEASGFAQGPWSQSAVAGDRFGAELKDGRVAVDPATGEAYRAFRDAGWGALGLPPDWGGQGMPYTIALACEEMWCAGNMALSLLPMLTASAAAALLRHGSAEVQALFVPKRFGRVGGRHGHDRAAGGLGSVADRGDGPARRRRLQALWPKDLHHLGRA